MHTSEVISNPGLNYIWKDEERRCLQRGEQLVSDSSQGRMELSCKARIPVQLCKSLLWKSLVRRIVFTEDRPWPETETEQDWLRRMHLFSEKFQAAREGTSIAVEKEVEGWRLRKLFC